jgi:predicted phosphoadenosine phosphosulfate sulfurtransferase
MFDILEELDVMVFRVKSSMNYARLYDITYQKTVPTIVAAMRTLNPTFFHC